MRLFHYTLFLFIAFFISCQSSDYSEEEKTKLEEAQRIHNEAMATFAESKDLLAELTEVRSELRERIGLGAEEPATQSASQGTASNNTTGENSNQNNRQGSASQNNTQENTNQNSTQRTADATDNVSGSDNSGTMQAGSAGNTSAGTTDSTTVNNEARKVLDEINKAQNELFSWMRNIYTVPGLSEKNEGEKTRDPAIGMDFDSRRLTKDIEIKEFPEGTGIDEIYEMQKEMKENIDRINEDMKKAIKEGKNAYR